MCKTKQLMIILISILVLIMIFPSIKYAKSSLLGAEINEFEPKPLEDKDTDKIYALGGSVAGKVQLIGTIISIGTLMIIGIRYMIVSVDEKAEYKERMVPYVIGAVLLFGASTIVNIVYKVFN